MAAASVLPRAAAQAAARPVSANTTPARAVAWSVAANGYYVATQALLLVVVARCGSPTMVGTLALALAIATPVQLLTNLQLRSAQSTDVTSAFRFAEYLVVRLAGALVASVLIVGIALAVGLDPGVAAAVAAVKAAEAVADVRYGHWQRAGRFDLVARSLACRGTASVLVAFAILAATGHLGLALAAVAASWGLVTHIVDAADAPAGDLRAVEPARALALVASTWPLGLAACCASASVSAPRYVLYAVAGEHAVGLFASMTYLTLLGSVFAAAIGHAIAPRVARAHSARRQRAARRLIATTLTTLALAGAVGTLIAALAGDRLLVGLFGVAWHETGTAFTWLAAAGAVTMVASFLNATATATRRFRAVLAVQLAVGAVTAGASLALVPAGGLVGAAQATGLGQLAGVAGAGWLVAAAPRAATDIEGPAG